eukprot:11189569-Heterocapsa_arctica.AAC.1
MDRPTYKDVLVRLNDDLPGLKEELREMGKLHVIYWACPFSVNQHRGICKSKYQVPACKCNCKPFETGHPACEMDKFDVMMGRMLIEANKDARHMIAIDVEGMVFTRAW